MQSFECLDNKENSLLLLNFKLMEKHIPSLARLNASIGLDTHPEKVPKDSLIKGTNEANNIESISKIRSANDFILLIKSVETAISEGVLPTRILKGSSGSYFCYNSQSKIVGVFKPKNEEPYGHLNPKWTKWVHRNLFPCCFGRSCIIPNLGYISEAAASFVDRQLNLNIVPRTEIVSLSSPSFHYSFKERWAHKLFGTPLPPKIGSFQVFLDDFIDSAQFFNDGYQILKENSEEHPLCWNTEAKEQFQKGFERLVVLDYLIRNTDRSSDNCKFH
jgi:hypothetical protein